MSAVSPASVEQEVLPGAESLHACTRTWFAEALESPTRIQREAWPVLAAGKSALLLAPTGSGKTLAAFLAAIDRLMFPGRDGSACSVERDFVGHPPSPSPSPRSGEGFRMSPSPRLPLRGAGRGFCFVPLPAQRSGAGRG